MFDVIKGVTHLGTFSFFGNFITKFIAGQNLLINYVRAFKTCSVNGQLADNEINYCSPLMIPQIITCDCPF
jgi:hypothetical protein